MTSDAQNSSAGQNRIVSLLPSATEILYWLGVGDSVVGVTYECAVPLEAADKPHVTNTIIPDGATPAEIDVIIGEAMASGSQLYTLDIELLRSLEPTIIVTQDLCRVCALPAGQVAEAVEMLGTDATVVSYDPMTLDGVLDEIAVLAKAVGAVGGAAKVAQARARLAEHRNRVGDAQPKVLLLEWPDPPYTPGHWIPDQIEAAGGQVLLGHPGGRSSSTTWDAVAATDAEVLIVAPCGFTKEQAEEQLAEVVARPELAHLPAIQNGRSHAIDADSFIVRPGPRLIDGVAELARLIHEPE